MPPALLLIAPSDAGLRLFGIDLVILQAERAKALGVGHVIVLVDRVGPSLMQGLAGLRTYGLVVDLARVPEDVANALHPEEPVLVFADARRLIASDRLKSLLSQPPPHVLCVNDDMTVAEFERIDATTRWAGAALVRGEDVRTTVAMLGDWDLASTIMRRAVQAGATRTTLPAEQVSQSLSLIESSADAVAAARSLLVESEVRRAGLGRRLLIAPLARQLARLCADSDVPLQALRATTIATAAVAALAACGGWIAASMLLLLFALILTDTVGIVHRATGGPPLPSAILPAAATLVMLAMGVTLFIRTAQWGCLVLALLTVGATALASRLLADDLTASRWRADIAALAAVGAVAALIGLPVAGLGIMAGYALAGVVWAHRAHLRRLAPS